MNIAQRFNDISRVLIAFLLLDLALLVAMAPWNIVMLLTDGFAALPLPAIAAIAAGAWCLAAPAMAAAFAAYRDAATMRNGEYDAERDRRNKLYRSTAAIADPYWSPAEDHRTLRPYIRTYLHLAPKAFTLSVIYAIPLAILAAGACAFLAQSAPCAAVMIALLAFTMVAHLVSLNAMVEFPNARYSALVRTGFVFAARRFPFTVLALAILVLYLWLLLQWPWIMLLFGTGLTFFFLYHTVEQITKPVLMQMIAEEIAPEQAVAEQSVPAQTTV
ncbi:hypothetical protein [Bifidobacterium oedipodis]|uniref:DUF624 domain-containing protein n=1 Tax=Bifidobacterium oedipodis TaxID=2675322 RepID=A0A7Y0ERI0_9BIFI|nr:hypothetical protein [Bifidobacterium sp. DSM 109957]NMM95105.1 hypothetical protein [Bifidobacterium sp. DSM 109957]